jgi:hypothetical protein
MKCSKRENRLDIAIVIAWLIIGALALVFS